VSEIFKEIINHLDTRLVLFFPKLFQGLIIFLIFWIVSKGLKRIILRLEKNINEERKKIIQLIGSTLKITTLLIGLITALETMGLDVTAMVAGLGLTGFALSFALKDALSNLLAGILIILYQPFKSGDKITVSGCEGNVIEINLRYTKLDGAEKEFLIPNSICFSNWVALSK
jgi:small conductance mechanosensitive channel